MQKSRIDIIGQNGNDGLAYDDIPPDQPVELPTDYQTFIHLSRYSRWREEDGRRESWNETVGRVSSFWRERFPEYGEHIQDLFRKVQALDIMPSMRTLMSAGKPLERDNVAGFNCAYTAIDSPRRFDEILYILMCGTGMGFSVERQFISQLPEIPDELYDTDTTIVVADSKIGWAKAYKELISLLYQGQVPQWDVSKVRAAGERLKTFGGRASGPKPLVELFKFTVEVFRNAKGRKLQSIECHDMVCKIAEVVVVGGVRRSALISLSNLTDERMRLAKSGQWWVENAQRALANNSVCYTEKPDMGIFMREWESLYESKSGERGIFNREAANKWIPDRRKELGIQEFGCNPCSEILLRSQQFCNLTEVIVRSDDTLETLTAKVKAAAAIGTLQATLTDFRYLSKGWAKNTAEEALLGVSFTGIMDNKVMSGKGKKGELEEWLEALKTVALIENQNWADSLGINPATAITCVKPSGTVSQLVDSSSGIHTRYAPYYIRTVRADKKDPIAIMMKDLGYPVEDDVMKPDSGLVFSFPIKAPKVSVFRDDMSVIEQLEIWKTYQLHWTEHKPSVTIYVKEEEWMTAGAWIYENFDICSGVSFLPHSDHSYQQAPYQEISKKEYDVLLKDMPKNTRWNDLGQWETDDSALENMKELACSAGACELI